MQGYSYFEKLTNGCNVIVHMTDGVPTRVGVLYYDVMGSLEAKLNVGRVLNEEELSILSDDAAKVTVDSFKNNPPKKNKRR